MVNLGHDWRGQILVEEGNVRWMRPTTTAARKDARRAAMSGWDGRRMEQNGLHQWGACGRVKWLHRMSFEGLAEQREARRSRWSLARKVDRRVARERWRRRSLAAEKWSNIVRVMTQQEGGVKLEVRHGWPEKIFAGRQWVYRVGTVSKVASRP